MTPGGSALAQVGIGLRQPHHAEWLQAPPRLGFVEVHSENFFADGGAALAVLRDVRSNHPVSLHGVGLGLGSAAGLDAWHLDRLVRLVERVEPVRVSDHASFARVAGASGAAVVHANDLLPIAFDEATLALMVRHLAQVQERLQRQILVENVAAYLAFDDATMSEPAFFGRLCRESGCGMLLDLNNLMVNALNAGGAVPAFDACLAFIDAIPPGIVGEIHLAGHADDGELAIDDHGSRVRPAVWALFEAAVRRFGVRPTLIEWDTDLPPLDVLLDEAAQAAALQSQAMAAAA